MKASLPFALSAALVVPLASSAASSATASPLPVSRLACSWRVVPSPSRGASSLTAVAATSGKDAWAVGNHDSGSGPRTLVERWNGTRWKVVPSPNPATRGLATDTLSGVVAISKNNAWAFGFYEKPTTSFRTLVEHWNGSSWSVVPSPNSGSGENVLLAGAAVTRSDIWAVGYRNGPGPRRTLVERWDGTKWRIVPSPSPGPRKGDSFLFGVAAVRAREAWAVGTQPASFGRTLAIRWNGTKWLTAKTANPGQGDRFLQGVAAPSARYALAVGSDLNGVRTRALAERWTGAAWSVVPSASPAVDYNSLQGVAARSPSDAWAVGARRTTQGSRFATLVERWTGRAWVQVQAPSPGRRDDSLSGVAAVPKKGGFWAVGAAGPNTLVERCLTG